MTDLHGAAEQAERQAQIEDGIRRLFDRYRRTGQLENELPWQLRSAPSLEVGGPASTAVRRLEVVRSAP